MAGQQTFTYTTAAGTTRGSLQQLAAKARHAAVDSLPSRRSNGLQTALTNIGSNIPETHDFTAPTYR